MASGKALRGLDRRLSEVKGELARLQQKSKRQKKKASSRVSSGQRAVVQALLVLRTGEPTAPERYLRDRCGLSAEGAAERVQAELDVWWQVTEPTARNQCVEDPHTGREAWALRTARAFLLEARLEAWVSDQNLSKGLTPTSGLVLEAATRAASELHHPPPSRRRKKHAFQWLRRVRKRWGLHLGCLRPLEHLEPEEMQLKANRC